ncbi:putative RNA-directed DNA polymerase, eukaryota, reverse transcriptase zinc-binding domain protein [Tanacetum coccineum]
MHHYNGSYIMFGDMNAVRNEQERVDSIFNNIEADYFNSFIDATGLVDLPIGGRCFTWMNKAGTKLSKLDRFLISEDVIDLLPDIRITALNRIWSDHNHILLHVDKIDFGPSLFKLYNSWLLRDGFDDLTKSEWDSIDSNNSGFPIKCHEKFCILKAKIRQWNNNNKTMERNRKAAALEELSSIEKKIDEGSASPSDTENRLNLLHELEIIDKFASMDLIQKARVKWDIEGDENTKFFHGLINQKRRNQMINGIMVEGNWITDPSLIKDAFFQFYKVKFQAQDSQVSFPNLPHSQTLNSMDRDYLERLVTHEEIKEAVWDCGSSKAPGPDGFSFAFVKKYWDIIKKDLHDFINSFFASCDMPYGANSSFFTLIPKVNNPTLITDFRPISLIGIHYKIIAKILANRLSKVIDKIVSKEQSAFIAGPFDSISWNYLDHILDSLGFGLKWRSWIKTCLSSSRVSILVNGSPTSEFSINRSLRQGDPLSPFLFILVMEGLHNAFADAVGNGLISGININNSSINNSHLFFADDVIITTGWNARDLENIICVLHVFHLASGLKINIHKSNIYGIGVNKDEVYNMASNAGCIAGNIPFNYLGLPIGSNMKSIASWKMLIDRFRSRLSTWKASLLSIGVVKAFHGHEGGFDNNGCSVKGTWANIVGSSNFLHSKGIILNNSFRFNAGCGTRIRFWKNIWVGEAPLSIRTNIGVRNLAFFRDMLNEIGQLNIVASEDTYQLPHRLNLSLHEMYILAISCSSCNANVESANHIFFECIIAYDLWKLMYRWCEIPFVQDLSVEAFKDWLSSWHAPKEKKRRLFIISTSQFDFIMDGLAEVPSNDRVFGQWLNALFQKAAFLSRLLPRDLFGVSLKTTSE